MKFRTSLLLGGVVGAGLMVWYAMTRRPVLSDGLNEHELIGVSNDQFASRMRGELGKISGHELDIVSRGLYSQRGTAFELMELVLPGLTQAVETLPQQDFIIWVRAQVHPGGANA